MAGGSGEGVSPATKRGLIGMGLSASAFWLVRRGIQRTSDRLESPSSVQPPPAADKIPHRQVAGDLLRYRQLPQSSRLMYKTGLAAFGYGTAALITVAGFTYSFALIMFQATSMREFVAKLQSMQRRRRERKSKATTTSQ